MKLCFATNNKHKLVEIQNKLGKAYELISLSDLGHDEELPENQDTLEGNSLEKAQFIYDKYGINCFADDTGLLVNALNGAPGVLSARFAGDAKDNQANMDLLLSLMKNITDRRAAFVTVISLIIDGQVHQFRGEVQGTIAKSKTGEKGFGYDPIFIPDGLQKTFAELDLEEKNRISHRAKAVTALVAFLQSRS